MIFVTVGTNEARFDRLLEALDALSGDEELIVQHGPSPVRPRGAACVDFIPFDELVEHVRRARLVITHAGVGSIMVCLANGTRPVVMARQHAHGEAVDDHQVGLARRMEEAGLVTVVDTAAAIAEVTGADGHLAAPRAAATRLVDDLTAFLATPGSARRRSG